MESFLLFEIQSKEDYLSTFNTLLEADPRQRDRVSELVNWGMNVLKKNDRIVWFLRIVKLHLLRSMIAKAKEETNAKKIGVLEKIENKELAKFRKAGTDLGELYSDPYLLTHRNFSEFLSTFKHFYTETILANVTKINLYTYQFQTPQQVITDLTALEEEKTAHLEELGDLIDDETVARLMREEGDTIFLDLGEGWYWFHLPRNECDVEGEAMGHCGTGRKGATLYSLRKKVPGGYRPVLTFEVDKEGYIRQAKTIKNRKPGDKYHPKIVELLKSEEIRGTKRGAHKPETDFVFQDLSSDQQKEVLEVNSNFEETPSNDLVSEYNKNGLSDKFLDLAQEKIDRYLEYVEVNGVRQLRSSHPFGTIKELIKDHLYRTSSYRNKEEELLVFTDREFDLTNPEEIKGKSLDDISTDFEEMITPAAMESFLYFVFKTNPSLIQAFIDHAKRHGVDLPQDTEELIDHVIRSKSNTKLYDLVKNAVGFGFESSIGGGLFVDFLFRVYILGLFELYFYFGAYFVIQDSDDNIVKMEDLVNMSMEDFLDLDVRIYMDVDEYFRHIDETYYDDDEDDDFKYEIDLHDMVYGILLDDLSEKISEEGTFSDFKESNEAEELREKYFPASGNQTYFPGMKTNHVLFNQQAAYTYLVKKIQAGLLENHITPFQQFFSHV